MPPKRPRSVIVFGTVALILGLLFIALEIYVQTVFFFGIPGALIVLGSAGLFMGKKWTEATLASGLVLGSGIAVLAALFGLIVGRNDLALWTSIAFVIVAIGSMLLAFRLRGADVQNYLLTLRLARLKTPVQGSSDRIHEDEVEQSAEH